MRYPEFESLEFALLAIRNLFIPRPIRFALDLRGKAGHFESDISISTAQSSVGNDLRSRVR